MRILSITLTLVLAWVVYVASPFVSLYRLTEAVRARDVAAINERVDFKALRVSLSRQILTDYLVKMGRSSELSGMGRQAVAGTGATLADPIVARFLNAEALVDLFGERGSRADGADPGFSFDLASGQRLWELYWNSVPVGFTQVTINLEDPTRSDGRLLGLKMRLNDWTWKLHGIELPADLRARLVDELQKSAT